MSDVSAREQSRRRWEASAEGWGRRRGEFQAAVLGLSHRMVDWIQPQPGHRVLELAAGPGDTGLLAAELIAPGGTLICSDVAEGMLEVARRRAAELGITNVEFAELDAEWIDLPTATVDAVLCRFGYMLLSDPAVALRETRRVLRPGGRVALAVWADAMANPWMSLRVRELVRRGLSEPPAPGAPGMFALADPTALAELLADSGFVEIEVEAVDFLRSHESLDAYWSEARDLGVEFARLTDALAPAVREELYQGLGEALAPYTGDDGAISIPARALMASAEA